MGEVDVGQLEELEFIANGWYLFVMVAGSDEQPKRVQNFDTRQS